VNINPSSTANKPFRCYDCGSILKWHHTELCEFADPGDIRDLPALATTQWWTESASAKRGIEQQKS
jgi:hypothetical protein